MTASMERNGRTGRIYRTCFSVRKYAMKMNNTEKNINKNLSCLYFLSNKINGENTISIGFRMP
jgi:hypothetical protein